VCPENALLDDGRKASVSTILSLSVCVLLPIQGLGDFEALGEKSEKKPFCIDHLHDSAQRAVHVSKIRLTVRLVKII